jgi:TPR repeat protein
MYANGNGVDRNIPLAMLWWSRSSRAAIPDTMTRTAQYQLAQLRRRIHREQFTPTEQQDVLTGFSLIRQDLANQAPVQFRANVSLGDVAGGNRRVFSKMFLQWMVERALALDDIAHQTLREWFVDGVFGQLAPQDSFLQQYWLQVAKEGDPVGCELIEAMTPKQNFPAVRQACQSLGK